MMSKTKWLAIVLTLCLIVSSIVVVSATGEGAQLPAEAEKNGIHSNCQSAHNIFYIDKLHLLTYAYKSLG